MMAFEEIPTRNLLLFPSTRNTKESSANKPNTIAGTMALSVRTYIPSAKKISTADSREL